MEKSDAPAVGQRYEDTAINGEWVEILHVGSEMATVQRRTHVARYPLFDFHQGARFRCVSAEVKS